MGFIRRTLPELLGIVAGLLLAWSLTGCYTSRQTAEHGEQRVEATATNRTQERDTAATDWWRFVSLRIDSVVIVPSVLDSLPDTAGTANGIRASPRPARVKLAGLAFESNEGKNAYAASERDQTDSAHLTGAAATDSSRREETTGIAKPPDLTVIVALLLMAAAIFLYIKKQM